MVFEINSETKWPSQRARQGVGTLQSQASLHPEYPVFTDGKQSLPGQVPGPECPSCGLCKRCRLSLEGHGSLALLTPVTAWPIFPGFLRQHWGLRRLLPSGQGLGHPPGFKLSNFIHVRFSLKQFSIPYESPPKSLETQPFFPPCIGFSKNVKSLWHQECREKGNKGSSASEAGIWLDKEVSE